MDEDYVRSLQSNKEELLRLREFHLLNEHSGSKRAARYAALVFAGRRGAAGSAWMAAAAAYGGVRRGDG
jgi:hypothetical protein